jgi:hypothetical protein
MKLARTVAGAALVATAVAGVAIGLLTLGTAGATSGRRAGVDAPPGGAASAAAAGCGRPLGVLSDTLGLPASDIRRRVRAGETVAQLAAAQGVDRQAVLDTLVAAGQARIDRGVQSGRLTDEQASQRSPALRARVAAAVDNPMTGRTDRRPVSRRLRAQLAATLGISPADLRQARASGQSVAEIGEAHGIDRQQVIDRLVDRARERITALVDAEGGAGDCG